MIKFKPGNLRVPKFQRPVYVVAAGTTDYRKKYPEYKLEELCMMAFRMLLEENDLKMDPLEVKGLINMACYGEFADHFQDQLLCEAKVHDYLGLDPLPNVGVKTGGATGGYTTLVGANSIASGYSDCTLVMGWERMDEVDTRTGNFYIATAACKDFETRMARMYAAYYAPMARRFAHVFNVKEDIRAAIAVKNKGYACFSPFAQAPAKLTVEEVLSGRITCDPLRMHECCVMSVGAAAMLLCDEATAYKLSDHPMRLSICGGTHTLRVADRRNMEVPLLPNEKPGMYDWMEKELNEPYPGFQSFLASRFASYMAYRMAGITGDPCDELDLVELHDAFTISDLQTYGDIGLRPYGKEEEYITSGDAYHGGRCPSNLSGGLLGTMHAVGATGIFQGMECLWQLQNKYDKFHGEPKMWERYGKKKPDDWKSLQIPRRRRALWISHAGVGSHVTCGILENPEEVKS
jgi:acetyl-CoA C-acetyltransferase